MKLVRVSEQKQKTDTRAKMASMIDASALNEEDVAAMEVGPEDAERPSFPALSMADAQVGYREREREGRKE
jgi:hypothetical protein